MGFVGILPLEDLGIPMAVRVWTDSSATIGICSRRGLGKLRHVDTQCLWIQQRVREKDFELRKVRGDLNPADLCTKHLPGLRKIESLAKLFGCRFRDGRAVTAPQLRGGTEEHAPLLSVLQELVVDSIEWGGTSYPALLVDGERVPEAYAHRHDCLPHEHENLDGYFPRAIACAEIPADKEAIDEIEIRGRRLGQQTPKFGRYCRGQESSESKMSPMMKKPEEKP